MKEGYQPWKRTESKESPELFRASLGFDFIFTTDAEGEHRPVCVEINGDNSGIRGVQEIPNGQIDPLTKTLASIRARENEEFFRKVTIAEGLQEDFQTGIFQPSKDAEPKIGKYIEKSIRKERMFKHSFKNPELIQNIALDKQLQVDVVPEKYQPRTWKPGMWLTSSTGAWIAKPRKGIQGIGIHVMHNDEIEEYFKVNGSETIEENIVLQELIQPDGADVTLGTLEESNPASLRLLMDFIYREDGAIEPVYEVAYQRVSPHDPAEIDHGVDPNEVYIVNKGRGARAYAASPKEIQAAREASLEIIRSLATVVRKAGNADPSSD